MTLNTLCTTTHAAALAKGWYDKKRELPELLMLIVSELSEALEADRKNKWASVEPGFMVSCLEVFNAIDFETFVKDTVEDEIADTFIRLADLCGYYNIDIEAHIAAKMKYNETRPIKHNKLY